MARQPQQSRWPGTPGQALDRRRTSGRVLGGWAGAVTHQARPQQTRAPGSLERLSMETWRRATSGEPRESPSLRAHPKALWERGTWSGSTWDEEGTDGSSETHTLAETTSHGRPRWKRCLPPRPITDSRELLLRLTCLARYHILAQWCSMDYQRHGDRRSLPFFPPYFCVFFAMAPDRCRLCAKWAGVLALSPAARNPVAVPPFVLAVLACRHTRSFNLSPPKRSMCRGRGQFLPKSSCGGPLVVSRSLSGDG